MCGSVLLELLIFGRRCKLMKKYFWVLQRKNFILKTSCNLLHQYIYLYLHPTLMKIEYSIGHCSHGSSTAKSNALINEIMINQCQKFVLYIFFHLYCRRWILLPLVSARLDVGYKSMRTQTHRPRRCRYNFYQSKSFRFPSDIYSYEKHEVANVAATPNNTKPLYSCM